MDGEGADAASAFRRAAVARPELPGQHPLGTAVPISPIHPGTSSAVFSHVPGVVTGHDLPTGSKPQATIVQTRIC